MVEALHFEYALLPGGWAENVRIELDQGAIVSVRADQDAAEAPHVRGAAIPGLPNLHCHAFQRGMAGLAERRGPANDSFWTWRDVMYRFVGRASPDDIEAIAAFAYMEMLERGFTAVGEFHYIHHATDGSPFADIAEMAGRIAAAATETGIGLTLLPAFYAYGGFGGAPPAPGQRRFINTPGQFLRLVERCRSIVASLPSAAVGIAPHSLRAVTPDTLREITDATPDGPIHIHAAEQTREVEDCVAWSGLRPVEWLLDHVKVDQRWCLIHATHMTQTETSRLAASGAVAGLCPLTEASLGDGTFNGEEFLRAGGRFGVGSDSNIEIDAAAELRMLEYSQRLAGRSRNVMTTGEGESTGNRLFTTATLAGAQALSRPIGALEPGRRADIVVLDTDHPDLASTNRERWLDLWIFSAGRSAIRTVYAGGNKVVSEGRHRSRDIIVARYRAALRQLLAA